MKRKIVKFLPYIFIFSLIVIFFNKTLTGEQMFITPDYGQADILHAEYSSKVFISRSIKQNISHPYG